MTLLIIFLIALVTGPGGIAYQIHRRRNPFFIDVDRHPDRIEIDVRRRGFAKWPSDAVNDLKGPDEHGYRRRSYIEPGRYVYTVDTISVEDDEADEKIIESVLRCKQAIKKWDDDRSRAEHLENSARKALKR